MTDKNLKKALGVTALAAAGLIGFVNITSRISGPERLEAIVTDDGQAEYLRSIRDPLVYDGENQASYEAMNEKAPYQSFRFPDEIPKILKHANRRGVEPELLMAIRMAEGGKDHLAYGIIPANRWQRNRYNNDEGYELNGEFHRYVDEKEKQLAWAARTLERNMERFDAKQIDGDFISYLAEVYAPVGVNNDPKNLNKNWENNVRFFYNRLKEGR
jgi:hypothetical protein